jgi:CRISPR-associated protein Csh1
MLMALKELGDLIVERRDKTGLDYFLTLDRLLDTERIICMDFNWDGKEVNYRGVHAEHGGNKEHTLYSSGTSRGGDYTPTSLISYRSPEKAVRRIWEYGFFAKTQEKNPLITGLKEAFDENREKIYSDVKEAYEELEREEQRGCLLTLTIWENETTGNYIDSYKVFREAVEENVLDSWTRKYGEESEGFGSCSLCKDEEDLVGFGFPFPFRSFDKIGFAPSLNTGDAWKQLPACKQCAYSLKAAQSFLDENSFSFGIGSGIEYYIIPDFPVSPPDEGLVQGILEGKSEDALNFFSAEEYYTDIILNSGNTAMTLVFLFYTRQQSQQRIEKYVEDVSPSWIKRLYKLMERVEEKGIFSEEEMRKIISQESRGGWSFPPIDTAIWRILPDQRILYDSKELALDLAKRILRGERINEALLYDMMASEIQRRFRAESRDGGDFYESTLVYSLNSFMFILFLNECGLIESGNMSGSELVEEDNRFEEFFESYAKAFDKPEKRAVFLEGILTKWLMNVQFANIGSTPFRSKLHGMKLDVTKIKSLLGEIDSKLDEYDLGYMDLRRLLSAYMVEAEENNWDISRDEVTYYFTLGLNLSNKFRR